MDRTLPISPEAEMTVLSCIMQDNNLIRESKLRPEFFASEELQTVFQVCKEMITDWKKVDAVILSQKLWDESLDKLREIETYAITSAQYHEYERIVIDNYIYRKTIKLCQEVIGNCYNKKEIEEIKRIASSLSEIDIETVKHSTLVQWSIDAAFELENSERDVFICPFGFEKLNGTVIGYREGSLMAIGARPWVGKSTLALNLAIKCLESWVKCSFFSTEMLAKEIHTRFLANRAQVSQRAIEQKDESALQKVADSVLSLNTDVDCTIFNNFWDFSNMCNLIRKEASQWSRVIFIDYLQQLKNPWKFGTHAQLIGDMTTRLKYLAMELGIQVVICCQLNRETMTWWDMKPKLHHLKSSWDIEQDCDVVMFLHDESKVDPSENDTWEIDLIVAKNRNWADVSFKIWFLKKYFLFYDV